MESKKLNDVMQLFKFDSASWAVFNCNERDRTLAKRVFSARFSPALYNSKIFPIVKNGVMAIFDKAPDRFTAFYVAVLADIADARHVKKQQKAA